MNKVTDKKLIFKENMKGWCYSFAEYKKLLVVLQAVEIE